MQCQNCKQTVFVFKKEKQEDKSIAICPFCRTRYIVNILSIRVIENDTEI